MPISSSVRMTRMAISPRLATRTLVNTGGKGTGQDAGLVRVVALEEGLAPQHLPAAYQEVDVVAAVLRAAAVFDVVSFDVAAGARHCHQAVRCVDLAGAAAVADGRRGRAVLSAAADL